MEKFTLRIRTKLELSTVVKSRYLYSRFIRGLPGERTKELASWRFDWSTVVTCDNKFFVTADGNSWRRMVSMWNCLETISAKGIFQAGMFLEVVIADRDLLEARPTVKVSWSLIV